MEETYELAQAFRDQMVQSHSENIVRMRLRFFASPCFLLHVSAGRVALLYQWVCDVLVFLGETPWITDKV
jgi:hypothetical protein